VVNLTLVEGKDRGKIVVYALSTCGWCEKTKQFLQEQGLQYYYANVDLTSGDERKEIMEEIGRWNSRKSFPTIVVKDKIGIVGFNKESLLEAVE